MKSIVGVLIFWGLAVPFILPWVLIRLGIYKRWYLARAMPPFIWNKALFFIWPASAIFVFAPIIAILPINDDIFMRAWAIVSVSGIIAGLIIAIWTPRWAKPKWQQYLEDTYSKAEIRRYIPVWRVMDAKRWGKLLDSEEGIDELVAIARGELGK